LLIWPGHILRNCNVTRVLITPKTKFRLVIYDFKARNVKYQLWFVLRSTQKKFRCPLRCPKFCCIFFIEGVPDPIRLLWEFIEFYVLELSIPGFFWGPVESWPFWIFFRYLNVGFSKKKKKKKKGSKSPPPTPPS